MILVSFDQGKSAARGLWSPVISTALLPRSQQFRQPCWQKIISNRVCRRPAGRWSTERWRPPEKAQPRRSNWRDAGVGLFHVLTRRLGPVSFWLRLCRRLLFLVSPASLRQGQSALPRFLIRQDGPPPLRSFPLYYSSTTPLWRFASEWDRISITADSCTLFQSAPRILLRPIS